jgi:hypothetical protein
MAQLGTFFSHQILINLHTLNPSDQNHYLYKAEMKLIGLLMIYLNIFGIFFKTHVGRNVMNEEMNECNGKNGGKFI